MAVLFFNTIQKCSNHAQWQYYFTYAANLFTKITAVGIQSLSLHILLISVNTCATLLLLPMLKIV